MKTRLFLVLLCLVWAVGCGNRDPDDIDTGYGRVETATLLFCNNSNCVGGINDGMECADDLDCGAGGIDDPRCEILVPFNECFGGSVPARTPCETVLDCGAACDAGILEGLPCADTSDCFGCVGGRVPNGTPCSTAGDCGGSCVGGTIAPDGAPCQEATTKSICGGSCVGGTRDGQRCNSDGFCINFGGTECSIDGVECVSTGECVQSGECIPGECNQVSEGCVGAVQTLDFEGNWQSCLNLDAFIGGTTNVADAGRLDGPPVTIDVSGCNSATLDVDFSSNGVPEIGCVRVQFTTSDRPGMDQCSDSVNMVIDF